MASKTGSLVVRFVGDTRDLSRSSVRVSKTLGGVSKVGKGLAIGVAAVAGAVGVVAVQTTKDLMRVERLGAQTEAVIKATGGAAGRTRKQVDALSGRLERMSGAEAEVITEGQNMLLTFKNIKGKQFDEASKAMLDMGVAMNKGSLEGLDLQKTSILMGKALNDPIKGLTALTRVGVSFTDKQKEQIKAMQEAGNVAGAQKVILKELKSEFGGAAKAAGSTTEGMIAKIKNTFGNIAESTLSFVLPMLQKVATWVNDKVMPAVSRFGDWLKNDGAVHLKAFGGFLKDNVLPPLKSFGGFLGRVAQWLAKNKDFTATLAVVLGTMAGAIGVVVGAMKVWAGVQTALNIVLSANPIGIVIVAVAALVAGLVFFFTKTKAGQKIVKAVWGGIKSAIKGVSDWWTKTAWPAFKTGLTILGAAFRAYLGLLKKIWVDGVWGTLKKVWGWIDKKVFDKIRLGLLVLRIAFKLGRDKIGDYFSSMRDKIGRVGDWIRKNVFGRIRDALGVMKDSFRNAKDAIGRIWNGLKTAASKPVKFLVQTVWNNGLRRMLNAIPGVDIKPIQLKFNRGGPVNGPGTGTSDSVVARLSKGEHVWTAREVAAAGGQRAMYAMRQAVLKGNLHGDPAFAQGGALDAARIAQAQKFARSQAGKPYGWGAVGPAAYDCSGFMSALTNVLRGQTPYERVGSTASFPWSGFKRGPGQFTIGSTPNYGFSGIGHMAGTLGGLNVESRGGRGVLAGGGAMGALSQGFSQMYHLGASGKVAMNDGSGGWLDTISKVRATMLKLPGQIAEMMSGGSWIGSFLRKLTAGLWSNLARHINKLIPDIGPIKTNPIPTKLARGGIVRHRPGGVFANIAEGGHDEAVIPLSGPHASRASGRDRVVHVDLGPEIMRIIRRQVKDGGGNVQLVLGRG